MKNIIRTFLVAAILISAHVISKGFCLEQEIAFGEQITAPILPGAIDLVGGLQKFEVNGILTKAACYGANISVASVLDFYKKEMIKRGWQLGSWETPNTVYFTKGGYFFYVASNAFALAQAPSFRNTKWLLVLSDKELRVCYPHPNINALDIKETGGRDLPFIPRYPGSTRLTSIIREDKEGFFLYASQDSAGKIASFYRKNLFSSGWRLSQEFKIPMFPEPGETANPFLEFKRGKKDKLTIYINYFRDMRTNFISISYNFAFTYPLIPGGSI